MAARFFGSWSAAKRRFEDWAGDEMKQSHENDEAGGESDHESGSRSSADGTNESIGSIIDNTMEDLFSSDEGQGPR